MGGGGGGGGNDDDDSLFGTVMRAFLNMTEKVDWPVLKRNAVERHRKV